ncbi:hypothetical protein FQN57_001966 [Myotisia sp. PD_48]|nr:hypothetical protein FQN57_001966 [Myotisia sp. PD_48]
MGPSILKKRKIEDGINGRTSAPKKKPRKQLQYHSSSEDESGPTDFAAIQLQDSDSDIATGSNNIIVTKRTKPNPKSTVSETKDDDLVEERMSDVESGEETDDSSGSDASVASSNPTSTASTSRKNGSKRNDPTAFSTSISKILSTKLPTSARADPLLSRSKAATQTSADIANEKLEKLARAKLRAEKKEALERGRVTDVLGVERGEAGETAELEKRLRKVAQRGVVKLFNAVRAAQVRGETAAREEKKKRQTVGMGEREKIVNEVSKQGFLDLINGKSGKKIEEA